MIVEYIRYNLKNHKTETADESCASFEAAYATAAQALDVSPVCLGYELTRCVEEPLRYMLRIEWPSIDAHLAFRRSDEFKPFFQAIKGFLPDIEEMQHYALTSVAKQKA